MELNAFAMTTRTGHSNEIKRPQENSDRHDLSIFPNLTTNSSPLIIACKHAEVFPCCMRRFLCPDIVTTCFVGLKMGDRAAEEAVFSCRLRVAQFCLFRCI